MTEPSQYFKGRTVQEQMNEVISYVDTRAAEVATAAIASDVAQVHQDMLDADADAQAAAASAAAAAGTLANAVKKTGEASQSIAGDIAVAGNLSGGVVTGTVITAPTPVNNTDAANKKYVDDADALKLDITNVNNYAVGLTDDQDLTGTKINTFTAATSSASNVPKGFVEKASNITVNSTSANRYFMLSECVDSNGVTIAAIMVRYNANGNVHFAFASTDANGNTTSKEITVFNRSTGTWS